jgi:hypothetical protein
MHQRTESLKDQRPTWLHAIGKLFPPDKEEDSHVQGHLFLSLFYFSHFHHFTANVTRPLPLEVIKEEARGQQQQEGTYQPSNNN